MHEGVRYVRLCDGHLSASVFFFFFQAEDGIRDLTVTGVQTCALPIFRVTVPEAGVPPVTLAGLIASDEITAGTTVSEALCVPPPYEPEMVTAVDVATALVVTLKLALVAPAGTVTLAGTAAAGPLPQNAASTPPAGNPPRSDCTHTRRKTPPPT